MLKSSLKTMSLVLAITMTASFALAAGPHEEPMTELANGKIQKLITSSVVIDAIKAQNAKHASLQQAEIDKLDKEWRAETNAADHPMIDAVLGNDLSAHLKKVKEESQGLYTEIFVMDNKGLNVGQSDVTSDYWQGDEAKWQKTYQAGPGAIHISEVEEDESTQRFQSQLSMAITDPATNEVIGAITIGVDIENLLQ
jgi:hypothetical protein